MKLDADTLGWDMVFAIPVAQANTAIAAAGTSPKKFVCPPEMSDGAFEMSGTFRPWRILGGEGPIIHLSIVLESGSFKRAGSKNAHDLAGLECVVEAFMDMHHQSEDDTTIRKDLRLSATHPTDHTVGISVQDIHDPAKRLGVITRASVRDLILLWFRAHLEDFDHVFATIDLSKEVGKGSFGWMKPLSCDFACVGIGDDAAPTLAILAMTSDQDRPPVQLSAGAIPKGAEAAFLVSPERLLVDLIQPGLLRTFRGAHRNSFKLTDDSGSKRLCLTHNLNFRPPPPDPDIAKAFSKEPMEEILRALKGKDYHGVLTRFDVEFLGDEIEIRMDAHIEISPGIVAFCRHTAFQGFRVVKAGDGVEATFEAYDIREGITDHWIEEDDIVKALEILGVLAAAILAAVVTALSGGAAAPGFAAIAAGAAAAGLGTAIALTPEFIAAFGHDDALPYDLLVLNTFAPVQWAGGQVFKVDRCELNRSLQLGGSVLAPPERT